MLRALVQRRNLHTMCRSGVCEFRLCHARMQPGTVMFVFLSGQAPGGVHALICQPFGKA